MKLCFQRMLAMVLVMTCLLLGATSMAYASDDAKMDQINALALTDYSAMFQISTQADGAYADAIARRLSESFQADGEAFTAQLLSWDPAVRDNIIGLIAYNYVQESRNGDAGAAKAAEADLAAQLEQARAKADLLQALQDEIQREKQD